MPGASLAVAGLAMAAGAVAAPLRAARCAAAAGYGRRGAAGGGRQEPPPCSASMAATSPQDVLQFERWLGREVDGVLCYTEASWEEHPRPGLVPRAVVPARPARVLVVPLLTERARHDGGGRQGPRNAHYRDGARLLATFRPQDRHIYVRTGWEFNGDWFQWSATGREPGLHRRVPQLRGQLPLGVGQVPFEWNVNLGGSQGIPERCYPGDAYVDLVGMDFYFNPEYNPRDSAAAWEWMLRRSPRAALAPGFCRVARQAHRLL